MRYSEILVENRQFFHTPLAFDAPVRGGVGSRWNSATLFGTEKLEWLGYHTPHTVKKFRRYLYSFRRNSNVTDGQTDRGTDRHRVTAIAALCIASHDKNQGHYCCQNDVNVFDSEAEAQKLTENQLNSLQQ